MAKKYYAVWSGRKRGIYEEWSGDNGAEAQVKGYSVPHELRPGYKKYSTYEEAVEALKKYHLDTDGTPDGTKEAIEGVDEGPLKAEPKRYMLVLHPATFVMQSRFSDGTANDKIKKYVIAKHSAVIGDKIHLYRYEDEKTAVDKAADKSFLTDEEYGESEVLPGVYVVRQDKGLLDVRGSWDQIASFLGLNAFTAVGYNEAVFSYVSKHINYYEEPMYYRDIYAGDGKLYYFTDGTYRDGKGVGYGVYRPKAEDIIGNDLTLIIEMAKKAQMTQECIRALQFAEKKTHPDDPSEDKGSGRNEIGEILAVMHAVLSARLSEEKEIFVVHDNENVLKYLTGEYKGKDLITANYLEDYDNEKLNYTYFLFFREVEKWDMRIRFIHVYSHVIEKDETNPFATKKHKSIELNDESVFKNHTLFVGNVKADQLAEAAII